MKRFLLFVSLASCALSAEALFVSVGGSAFPVRPITGTGAAIVTGPLFYGGTGEAPDASWGGKIVLLDRGGISFLDKVSRVQNFGGLAVIVDNNAPMGTIDFTVLPGTTIIPAVAVTQADGVVLKTKVGGAATIGPLSAVPPPMPVSGLPDPTGHAGEYLTSDGTKYVFLKPPTFGPGVAVSTEAGKGESVVFALSASGTTPFNYQWMKDGTNIAGATTATLTLKTVASTDAGKYLCLVSNPAGVAPSNIYTLSVR